MWDLYHYDVRGSLETFDYIIVGAGSAGCAVARRLSDDNLCNVLLLEAGGEADGFWNSTPAGAAKMHRSKHYNWNYITEAVAALGGRRLCWPAGKALGGSSAINGMVYVRGDRRDFDNWARLGNEGWSWNEVLPFFVKSENNEREAGPIHGKHGPLRVSDPVVVHPTVKDFVEAATREGLFPRDDFSGGDQEGVGTVQYTIDNGKRHSAFKAFIAPVRRQRKNLTIITRAVAQRILFDGHRAIGLEVLHNGQLQRFFARREVIVSSGTIRSPQLLMLSGVGDGSQLQATGIQVVKHLPRVGKNLQDHYTVRVQAETDRLSSYNAVLRGWRKYAEGVRYIATRRGYLALGTSSAAVFMRSGPTVDYSDVEISFRAMTFSADASGSIEVDRYNAISGSVYRVRPASRGEISLRSPDPLDPPRIEPNYLSKEEDISATISGIRALRRIWSARPISSRITRELLPGSAADNDDRLAEYIIRQGGSVFHPAGTCMMGRDPVEAVVDKNLRVHGIDRLRVIDASIMPVITSGNTNAPTIMIGEKGAAAILAGNQT